jgi:hypothetical protein
MKYISSFCASRLSSQSKNENNTVFLIDAKGGTTKILSLAHSASLGPCVTIPLKNTYAPFMSSIPH